MLGRFRHTHERAEPQSVLTRLYPAMRRARNRVDVDHGLRPHYAELHQIDERGAPGKILDAALPCGGGCVRGLGCGCRPLIGKGLQSYPPLAVFIAMRPCFTALTMFGYAAQRQRLPLMYSRISASFAAWPSVTQATADMIWPGVQ